MALPALAQAAEMSLRQSVEYALEHNRMLSAASQGVEQAEAQADMATGRLLPRIDASTGYMRTDSPLGHFGTKLLQQRVTTADFAPAQLNQPGYINNYQSRLGLTMPLFSGGALWAERKGAREKARSAELGYAYTRQQLVYQTIAAYAHARQLSALVNARRNAVRAADKRWQDARSLQRRGMAIKSDVMDARVHKLRAEVALGDAENSYAASLESLRLILGMNAATPIGELMEPELSYRPAALDDLIAKYTGSRADLLALQGELTAAESAEDKAMSGFLPNVDLVAAQEWNSDKFSLKNRNSMVGVNVSVNLFSGGSDRARMRAATSQRVSLEYRVADKRQQIGNEIRQAWRALKLAEQRYNSEELALQQTSESLRIKSLRHAQGLERTSDILDAQSMADASEVGYIRAKYDLVTARAALLLATGTLNEEAVR